MLRESVLGEARFDKALREYIKRWAFKHPTPDDFFRTMENVSGEELNWFWRGWFLNKWKIDQSVTEVKYVNGNFKNGAIIKVENIGQLPMPTVVKIKFKDGSVQIEKLPIEVWKRNVEWSFQIDSNKEINEVKLDPDGKLPDVNVANNIFKMGQKVLEEVNLQEYTGSFSSKEIPIKIETKVEEGCLTAQATGQDPFQLSYDGDDKFSFEQAEVTFQFSKDKKSFKLLQGGLEFKFDKN